MLLAKVRGGGGGGGGGEKGRLDFVGMSDDIVGRHAHAPGIAFARPAAVATGASGQIETTCVLYVEGWHFKLKALVFSHPPENSKINNKNC